MKKGKLVVIEGGDGSGKTTQIDLLSQSLKEKGIDFEIISFPQYGKNQFADQIEDYLDGELGKLEEVDPYFIAKAYASDRQTAKDLINSWLKAGKVVVSNRYVSSSKAHLGANLPLEKRKEFFRWLDVLEYQQNGMPKEDLTVLLAVDASIGKENVSRKHDPDIHEDNLKHLEKANKIYLDLARDENWVVINCMNNHQMKSKENIQKDLLDSLSMLLSRS